MRKKSYKSFADKKGFIGMYMRSQSNLETPLSYDFWSAVWILSSLLGRGVVIDRPSVPVYLNWYIILIAHSGVTRKSTAVNNANDFLRENSLSDSIILPDARTTAEGFEKALTIVDEAHAAINVSELIRFMGKERYTVQMPGFLTDLYDCPATRKSLMAHGDADSMDNIYLTLLSASTPQWLEKAINPAVVEGGFASRTMFVYEAKRKKRIAWPTDNQIDNAAIHTELIKCVTVAKKQGKITLTNNAKKRFTGWYNQKHSEKGAFAASFESREDAHVLKMAGILCISDQAYQIQTRHITAAISIINSIKYSGMFLFDSGVIRDSNQRAINRISEALIKAEGAGIRIRNLKKSVIHWMDAEKVNSLVSIMHEAKMVRVIDVRLAAKGRATQVVVGLPALTDDTLRNSVYEKLSEQF